MKKKNIILLIIAIVLFVLVGTTMTYFGWSSSAENKDQLVDVLNNDKILEESLGV